MIHTKSRALQHIYDLRAWSKAAGSTYKRMLTSNLPRGPKKKQTIFESTTEKVFEGEISSKTLVTRAYSTDSDKTESSDKLVRGGGSATESRGLPGIAKSKGPPNISSSSPVPFKDSTNLPSNAELSGTKSEVEGDRTNQIYFSSWGTLEKRDRPGTRHVSSVILLKCDDTKHMSSSTSPHRPPERPPSRFHYRLCCPSGIWRPSRTTSRFRFADEYYGIHRLSQWS